MQCLGALQSTMLAAYGAAEPCCCPAGTANGTNDQPPLQLGSAAMLQASCPALTVNGRAAEQCCCLAGSLGGSTDGHQPQLSTAAALQAV